MSNKKFSGKLSAKGYYIALILCAFAIGISGYLFYRNTNQHESLENSPSVSVDVPEENLEVIATEPDTQTTQKVQEPTTVTPNPSGKVLAPVSGTTAMDYCVDQLCYNATTRDWRTHSGVDIAASEGTPVCAAADGEVEAVTNGYDRDHFPCIRLCHLLCQPGRGCNRCGRSAGPCRSEAGMCG